MHAKEFILDTLAHFVRGDEGPPPGVPAHVAPEFEPELTWLCEWHSVTPIVLSSLERLALQPQMSRLTWERMKALAEASAALSTELLATADSAIAELERAGVQVLLMHDAAYPREVYPVPRLRAVETLEVLIKERDWPAVIEVCAGAGFTLGANAPVFSDGTEAMAFYQCFSPCVLTNNKGDRLRLRFRLFDPGEPDPVEASWRRVVPGEGGRPMTLPMEDQLIASCMIYNMSRFDKLLYAVDIGLILTRLGTGLDWDYVRQRLRSRSVYAPVVLAMQNAARAVKLPASTVKLRSPGILRKNLFFSLWSPMDEDLTAGRRRHYDRLRYCFLEMDGWLEKVRFVIRLLSPRRQWVAGFFGKPYTPWRRLKFVVLALRNRLGVRLT